jgi:hypothetical protein
MLKFKAYKWMMAALLLAGVYSCKSNYTPPDISAPNSYLVVEGTIVTGNTDSTLITLSHTVNLSGKTSTAIEEGAVVSVQDEAGHSYTLTYKGKGIYGAPALNLPAADKYRLTIKRANGSSYTSDYVQAKSAPAIDSVTYQALDDGLHVYVNTHDNTNGTRYYRWAYQEDWEFHSYYFSTYIADDKINNVRIRVPGEYVNACFQHQNSSIINLTSTAKLTQDVVSQQPITFVAGTSEKVNYIYSILVKQYALTDEAYLFWENMKKNTEQLGSIFDAQPTQLTGNIHNTADAREPVIGYISAGAVSSKRLYVKRFDITRRWVTEGNEACAIDSLLLKDKFGTDQVAAQLLSHLETPLESIQPPGKPFPIGYTGSSHRCADCTTRGTIVKPSFWAY